MDFEIQIRDCLAQRVLVVASVFVGEKHPVGVALREEARLFEGHCGANPAAFAHDADTAFRGAILVDTAIQDHAAAAVRAILFW